MTQEQENQAPETTPTTPESDANALAETAAPESIENYVEEREAQDAQEEGTPVKRASRYERLKRARDAYKQEAEELRKRLPDLEPQPPQESQNPYEDEIEQGRREAEFAEQLAQRDEAIRLQTEIKLRSDEVAKDFPDFHETIQFAKDCGYELPPRVHQLDDAASARPALCLRLSEGRPKRWRPSHAT